MALETTSSVTGLQGTAYLIIDNAGNIFNDYQNTYYPTILTICPNRVVTEAGQVDVADPRQHFPGSILPTSFVTQRSFL